MPNLTRRFEELSTQFDQLLKTKRHERSDYSNGWYVDSAGFANWKIKALQVISLSCGENSLHAIEFQKSRDGGFYQTNLQILEGLKPILDAARDDFEGGYCTSARALIQAELFSSELDQARELLKAGYHVAAAVIARVVLETTLRELCDKNSVSHGKLDKMNADLAKAGQYSVLKQKQITALADVGISAAHGHTDKFSAADVSDMIEKVEGFLSDQI